MIRGGFQRNSAATDSQQPAVAAGVRVGWQAAIAGTVEGLGYELVDVERAPRGLLRITIDRVPGRTYSARGGQLPADAGVVEGVVADVAAVADIDAVAGAGADAVADVGAVGDENASVTVEDCEKVTRQLQYVLEVEGLDYARLEVSSPGLDRPLKRLADYERFAGQAVQLVLKQPFKGRKNWQGVLTADEAPGDAAAPDVATVPAVGHVQQLRWNLVFKDGKAEQALNFTLEEVREARLVPVVNFKGRKAQDGGGSQVPAANPKKDGG